MSQNLDDFYQQVQSVGKLRTEQHARRWTRAVLQTLGLNISGAAKKELKGALPDELSDEISGVWWIFNFRDTNMTAHYFQERCGRRAGNTDPEFARYPVLAVFGAVQGMVSSDVSDKVADSLPPEVAQLWENAAAVVPA